MTTYRREFLFFQAKVMGAVCDKYIGFMKGSFVEQKVNPLPGGQPALFMLRLDAIIPAAQFCLSL